MAAMESEGKRLDGCEFCREPLASSRMCILTGIIFGIIIGMFFSLLMMLATAGTVCEEMFKRSDYEKFRLQVMDNNAKIAELQHQLQYLQTRRQCDMSDVYTQIENLEKKVFSKPESAADFPECE